MNLARTTTYLSFLALFAAHVVTGLFIHASGSIHLHYFKYNYGGKALPGLTEHIIPYATSNTPIIVGLIFGLGFCILLTWIETRSRSREYLPFFMTIGWIACFLHLATIFIAMTMPFIIVISGMKPT